MRYARIFLKSSVFWITHHLDASDICFLFSPIKLDSRFELGHSSSLNGSEEKINKMHCAFLCMWPFINEHSILHLLHQFSVRCCCCCCRRWWLCFLFLYINGSDIKKLTQVNLSLHSYARKHIERHLVHHSVTWNKQYENTII